MQNELDKEKETLVLDAPDVETLAELEDIIKDVLVVKDPGIIKLIAAATIGSRMSGDPIFLFIVGQSSGGKTEYINLINGLKFVKPLDTLTSNTFASGAKTSGGSASLLLKIQNGLISIKDFTTILDMNETSRKEIMSQLRVIFDGSFSKETGNGESIVWNGKISMIAAVTSIIHQRGSEYKSMGERFMNYEIEQPNEEEVQQRVLANAYDMKAKRHQMQAAFTAYINHVIDNLQDDEIRLMDEQRDELMMVAKYCTAARSGLEVHPRDDSRITFIPDKEGSSRVLGQLFALVRAFVAMKKAEPGGMMKVPIDEKTGEEIHRISDEEMNILKKIAFCSIPRKRRDALRILAEYGDGSTTGGVAMKLNYNTLVIRATMYELNALGFCYRKRDGMIDRWYLNDDWVEIITELEGIDRKDDLKLEHDDGDGEDFQEADQELDDIF